MGWKRYIKTEGWASLGTLFLILEGFFFFVSIIPVVLWSFCDQAREKLTEKYATALTEND